MASTAEVTIKTNTDLHALRALERALVRIDSRLADIHAKAEAMGIDPKQLIEIEKEQQ